MKWLLPHDNILMIRRQSPFCYEYIEIKILMRGSPASQASPRDESWHYVVVSRQAYSPDSPFQRAYDFHTTIDNRYVIMRVSRLRLPCEKAVSTFHLCHSDAFKHSTERSWLSGWGACMDFARMEGGFAEASSARIPKYWSASALSGGVTGQTRAPTHKLRSIGNGWVSVEFPTRISNVQVIYHWI